MWLQVPLWLVLWQRFDANVQNWVLSVPTNPAWKQKDMNTEPDLLTSQCCPAQPSVQKHTHTRSCTRCYKTWQLIPCFIYFIGCLVITSLSSLRDANLGDRARPMLHTRGKINNWANIRRTRQMLKSSTKDGAAGRRGLCVAFHCICTVNVPSGTTVCGRRCDLALSHLFFGTHFFFFSFLIFFFATCYSLVTPIIIFN